MSPEDRALILEWLTPEERYWTLVDEIEYKQGQVFIDKWLKGEGE